MINEIKSIYIRNDLAINSLTISAISQLVIKALFFYNEKLSIREIQKKLNTFIGFKISEKNLTVAISELSSNGLLKEQNNTYLLKKNYYEKINRIFNQRQERINTLLSKYFNVTDLNKEDIANWFEELNTIFFSEYCSEWIENKIGMINTKNDYIHKFKAIKNHKIYLKHSIPKSKIEWYANKFISYLKSYDNEDNSIMWDFANTMFSSKIITNNTFADKSIKDIFKDTAFILDTNILLYIDIEKDTYSSSYKALGEIFSKLNIEPVFFNISKVEYSNAIEAKIEKITETINNYEPEVYSKMEDIFLETAIERGCQTTDDFQSYFDDIRIIPTHIGDVIEIDELDDKNISSNVEKGKNDSRLKKSLNAIHYAKHNYNKHPIVLEHDAGLIKGVQELRKTKKAVILTRDYTLHSYSKRSYKGDGLPLAINLETIINLLAVDAGGIDVDPCDFLPLFANSIRNNLYPLNGIFQLEDLSRMFEIESEVTKLPSEEIVSIAKEINSARLNGDSVEKVTLKLHRKIESYRINVKNELKTAETELNITKTREKELSKDNKTLRDDFYLKRESALKQQYIDERKKKRRISFLVTTIFLILLFFIILTLVDVDSITPVYNFVLSLASSIIASFFFTSIFTRFFFDIDYNNKMSNIKTIIDEEYSELINR